MSLLRELSRVVLFCAFLSCKSDDTAAAPLGQVSSGGGGRAASVATPAGSGGPDAGTPPPAAGATAAAGAGGIPGDAGVASGIGAETHSCSIPDNIPISEDDADGGLDPTCQNVPRKVIANNCIGGICHDSNGPPASGLDLMAPCVAERMVNVKSHCQDLLIIDTANPSQSLLFDKLNSSTAKCGETMPFTGHLPPDELTCMNAWINAVIRAAR